MSERHEASTSGMGHLLIAAGSEKQAQVLTPAFETAGFTVEAFVNHKASRDALPEERFDFALVDGSFVRLHGILYIVQVQAKRERPLKIVLMTGNPDEHAALMTTYELDVFLALVAKPFGPEDAVQAMRIAIGEISVAEEPLAEDSPIWLPAYLQAS